MNISALTLRDLEYLVAVAEQEHFGKAATACHVSQPALSGQIKKVEDFLGVRLFERSNRNVSVTPVGQRIVSQARVVLEEARKIADLARADKQAPLTGQLRLGAIATLGPYYLPHVLAPLRKSFPKLELHLKEGLTDGLLADLRAGTLDVALASPTFQDDAFRVIPLFVEPFLLAAPKGHELSTKPSLRSSDLKAAEMVLLEDGHCLKDQTLELCPANRRGNIRQYHVTSLETLRHLVATGLGYTLIPLLAAGDEPRLKNLITYRAFDGKPVGREIVLVCRKRYPRMSDIDTLAEFLKKTRPEGTLVA